MVDAGSAHHEYEESFLGGERDEVWAAFYAAFTLGRLGPFMPPSRLTRILGDVESEHWVDAAVEKVTEHLS